MCDCGIRDGCLQFQHCLESKVLLLQDLYSTKEEKRKSDEARRKAEERLDQANEFTLKMEEAMKKAEAKAALANQATLKMEDAMKKAEEKAKLAQEATRKMKEEMEEIKNGKRQMELELADFRAVQNASRTRMKRIKRYALGKERCLHISYAAIVILVAVSIAMLGLVRCSR